MRCDEHPRPLLPSDFYVPGIFAVVKVVLHLVVLGRYGIFRDEFYYLACARHLDWGYVDHPPLSLAFLSVWTSLFCDGLLALRLPGILVGAVVTLMTGMLAREVGGGKFAQGLACLTVLMAPLFLALSNFYSMNVFDLFFWTALLWILVRYINTEQRGYWIVFGLVAGLALENKISVLFLGFGVVVALVLTHHRKVFMKREIWIGGALAGLLFLPYAVWQFAHDFATLEFMHNAATLKNTPTTPLQLFLGVLVEMHPLNAVVWLAGLGYVLFHSEGRKYRLLGLCFLVVFFAFAFTNGKVYYLAPIMPVILALGAVAWERWTRKAPQWRWALVTPLVVFGVLLMPMSLPVLSPEGFAAYQRRIGLAPTQSERGGVGALPQHFSDRLGWEALALFVAEHYKGIASEAGGARLTIVLNNYGEAGALEYFSKDYALPRAVCGHNNYFLWGPGDFSEDVFLVYNVERADLEPLCESVEELGRFTHPYVMPYENDRPLYLCRGLKQPIEEIWPLLKNYI